MKKRLITGLLAGVMASSVVIPVMADTGGAVPTANGTEVWAGVIIDDMDAKIKVEVPTLFAFVVNGTVTDDSNPVTSENGSIQLPNVKVKVTQKSDQDGAGGKASLLTEGNLTEKGKLPFTNYSTFVDSGSKKREGLKVKINGNIKNEGTDESRKYWEHTTSSQTGLDNFKKYNVSIDDKKFDETANGGLQMKDGGISLAAPDTNPTGSDYTNLDTESGYAITGETHYAAFDVSVGGRKKDYKQIEESAKIGTIVWTISAEVENKENAKTAPDEDYLSKPQP